MVPGPREVRRVHPNVILAGLSLGAGCAAVALLIPSPALAAN
jgi:hypothetical protein